MMLRPRLLLPILVAAGGTLSSCEKEDASPSATTLLGHRWLLTQVDGAVLPATSATRSSYLEFVNLGHCTVGLGPCNNFSSRFTLDGAGQQLSISPPITTRATCPAQALEDQYLTRLASTTRYEISGAELRLYGAAGNAPQLVFRQAPMQ